MAARTVPEKLVAELRKKFGDDSAMLMGESGTGVRAVCPTGIAVLDRWVLGVGGIPYGRVVEVAGAESSGKTTLMDKMLAGVQKDDGVAVLVETEHSFDPAWARIHGVNTDDLVLLQPDYLDGDKGALAQIEMVIERATRPTLIALDSVASTQTKREFDEGIVGDAAIGETARAWSRGLKILVPKLAGKDVALVLVNQTRAVIGKMFGPTEETTGGRAIKFYASIRLNAYHGKKADGGSARFMGVQAVKNKVCPPYRKAQLKLDFGEGFDERWAILDHAKEMGIVKDGCKSLKEALEGLHWEGVDEKEGEADGEKETA